MNVRGTRSLGLSPGAAVWDVSAPIDAPLLSAYSRLFVDARRVLGLTEYELARRLGTQGQVILALEQARFEHLPPWPETVRIVSTYLNGLGMDPRPVLHVLAHDIERHAALAASSAMDMQVPYAAAGPSAPQPPRGIPAAPLPAAASAGGDVDASGAARRWRARGLIGGWRRALSAGARAASTAVAPVARLRAPLDRHAGGGRRLLGGRKARRAALGIGAPLLVALAVANADIVRNLAAMLPKPVTRALAGAADHVRLQFAPVRDGLRWIEVEDPRSRRGDKLQTARR